VSSITGELGTQLTIVPSDLVTASGAAITGDLVLELIELPFAEDMVKYQVSSASANGLMSMGGAIHVSIRSNGEAVNLVHGKTLKVSFPCRQLGAMSLCYGSADSLGNVAWVPTSITLKSDAKKAADHMTTKPGAMISDEELAKQILRERDSLGIAGTSQDEFPLESRDFTALDAAKRRSTVHTYGVCSPVEATQLGWLGCGTAVPTEAGCALSLGGAEKAAGSIWVWAVAPDRNVVIGPLMLADAKAQASLKMPASKAVRFLGIALDANGGFLLGSDEVPVSDPQAKIQLNLAPSNPSVVKHYLTTPLAL
jgi:hypothetical protein